MILQKVDNIFDLEWGGGVKYGEVRLREEIEQSKYVVRTGRRHVARGVRGVPSRPVRQSTTGWPSELLKSGSDPAGARIRLKCSHVFNILDSSGSVGVTERTAYVLRVRQIAMAIAQAYVADARAAEP